MDQVSSSDNSVREYLSCSRADGAGLEMAFSSRICDRIFDARS